MKRKSTYRLQHHLYLKYETQSDLSFFYDIDVSGRLTSEVKSKYKHKRENVL